MHTIRGMLYFSYALFAIYYELNLLNVSEEIRYFYSRVTVIQ